MEELLNEIYETGDQGERYFNLKGASVSFVGVIDDILDHGIIVLRGHWSSLRVQATILVPVAHINYIQEEA